MITSKTYLAYWFQGAANANYQAGSQVVGPPPVQKMPQVVVPTPATRGFVPISNSGVQRPGMSQMQPPSPIQAAAVQTPVTPGAPPPTVQTADTSKVPGINHCLLSEIKSIVALMYSTCPLFPCYCTAYSAEKVLLVYFPTFGK